VRTRGRAGASAHRTFHPGRELSQNAIAGRIREHVLRRQTTAAPASTAETNTADGRRLDEVIALQAAFDASAVRSLRMVAEQLADLERQAAEIGHLKRQLRRTQRRLSRLAARFEDDDVGVDMDAFADAFRGDPADIKRRQAIYLDVFQPGHRVLDLGCGRGEFLELLREHGVDATGVERSAALVESCRARGLSVVHSDIAGYLATIPDASVDGIVMLQVVEHLAPRRLVDLIGLCGARLRPEGVVVAETVNTHCVTALQSFYLDPTHVRPVPPLLLRFMFEQGGFTVPTLRFSAPVHAAPQAAVVLDVAGDLPQDVTVYQDYAAIAVRRAACAS
jgi:2-polyprenyl-3-methyl-5-hydroxy-6-metoxy-1,4-benzoquinol methylase